MKNLTEQIFSEDKFLAKGLNNNFNINWESAKNEFIKVRGIKGKVIDFTSGILVNCLGYKNKTLFNQIYSLLRKGILHSYHYQTSIKKEYLELLYNFSSEVITDPNIYLTSSGTEATESCMKIMLRHGQKQEKKKSKILSIEGNYHGRTMGAALMGNGNIYSKIWPEISSNFPKINFPYTWEVSEAEGEEYFYSELKKFDEKTIDTICGIIIETYQGWGACSYPKSFIKAIENFCKKRNIIYAFDEMQAGFYRTGLKFGFQHYEVEPDIICIGKGMGGGLPLSGLIGKSKLMDLSLPGELSSTHSCNPVSCSAGIAVIKEMTKDNFKNKISQNSERFTFLGNKLKNKYKFLKKKSNFIGMVGAFVFDFKDSDKSIEFANNFCEQALLSGVLVIKTGRESVKLSPPLLINKRNIDKAFNIFDEILNSLI